MTQLASRQIFETVKSDLALFLDRRPYSAVDLMSLFALRQYAVDSTSTAVHVLNVEQTRFWKDRLGSSIPDRLIIHPALDHATKNDVLTDMMSSLLASVKNLGSLVRHHVIIMDSTSILLFCQTKDFCTFLLRLPKFLGESGGNCQTSIGILHHADIFSVNTERALKSISSSIVTLISSESKVDHHEFHCSVDHFRHQNGHSIKLETVSVTDEWRPSYNPTGHTRSTARPHPKMESADPASNLSFNLRLTTEEKAARNQVQLPHSRGGSVIYYEPDEADDIDYEDPDE